MSKDHRPCCVKERRQIESLGGLIDDGYLNGLLGITRALGDWHLERLVFTSQNAIDFTRRRLQEHNDVKLCCKEIVEEATKRGATDNLTVVVVSFHSEPPRPCARQRGRVRRSISAEGLQSLKCLLEG
ncbi:probable protein phosphatase 2C 27 [Hibiscus syriacus]|uniref:probable protein phosphatase 2C 27 n=1 Tax=Hibiscus syriacus TaxID=106335 RepID=UPI001923472A|nr:probable protein phosphatase 2C 27 [Hibiscus syriacus]